MAQNPQPVASNGPILAPPDPAPRSRLVPNEFEFRYLEHAHVVELQPISDKQAEALSKWDVDIQREILDSVVKSRRSWPPRGEGLNLAEQNVVVAELLRRYHESKHTAFERAAAAAQPGASAAQPAAPERPS